MVMNGLNVVSWSRPGQLDHARRQIGEDVEQIHVAFATLDVVF